MIVRAIVGADAQPPLLHGPLNRTGVVFGRRRRDVQPTKASFVDSRGIELGGQAGSIGAPEYVIREPIERPSRADLAEGGQAREEQLTVLDHDPINGVPARRASRRRLVEDDVDVPEATRELALSEGVAHDPKPLARRHPGRADSPKAAVNKRAQPLARCERVLDTLRVHDTFGQHDRLGGKSSLFGERIEAPLGRRRVARIKEMPRVEAAIVGAAGGFGVLSFDTKIHDIAPQTIPLRGVLVMRPIARQPRVDDDQNAVGHVDDAELYFLLHCAEVSA